MENNDISYRHEALRKATHFVALLIPTSYLILPRWWAVGALAAAFMILTVFEVVRLRRLPPWGFLKKFVGGMIRPKEERENFTGAFYILLAGVLTILSFPRYVAATAITFEILGDVASAMVGRKFGSHIVRGTKTWEGAIGFFVVAMLIIVTVPKVPYTVGIVGAIVATLVESISIHRDDNLTVPLSSGLTMHLLMQIFPRLP